MNKVCKKSKESLKRSLTLHTSSKIIQVRIKQTIWVVVLVALGLVLVVLGVVLELIEAVASHCCYQCKKNHPQDHQNLHPNSFSIRTLMILLIRT